VTPISAHVLDCLQHMAAFQYDIFTVPSINVTITPPYHSQLRVFFCNSHSLFQINLPLNRILNEAFFFATLAAPSTKVTVKPHFQPTPVFRNSHSPFRRHVTAAPPPPPCGPGPRSRAPNRETWASASTTACRASASSPIGPPARSAPRGV
jgi:hypothetical protein